MQVPTNISDFIPPAVTRKERGPVEQSISTPLLAEPIQAPNSPAAVVSPPPVHQVMNTDTTRESGSAPKQMISDDVINELLSQAPGTVGPSVSSSPRQAQNLLPMLSRWIRESVSKNDEAPRWPAPSLPPMGAPIADRQDIVISKMLELYRGLAGSHLFSARHLSRVFGQVTAIPEPLPETEFEVSRSELLARIVEIANSESDKKSVEQSVLDVAAESKSSQEAARLLIDGRMVWHGELSSGVSLSIERRDTWRPHPSQDGKIQRGAQLDIGVVLQCSGSFRILGSQWGEDISIEVYSESGDPSAWAGWADLGTMLHRQFQSISLVSNHG